METFVTIAGRFMRWCAVFSAPHAALLLAAAACHAETAASPQQAALSGHMLFDGLATGLVMGLGIYHLALFFFVRDRGYLRFACYSLAAGAYILSVRDYLLALLWPGLPVADSVLSWCLIMLTMQGFIRFTQEFLCTATTQPPGHRLLGAIHHLLYAGPIIGAPMVGFGLRSTGFSFNSATALGIFAVVAVLALRCHRAGFRPAQAYLAGNLFFCGGGAIYGMAYLGIVPRHPGYGDVVILGIAFQAVFFSLGVAERMARLKADLNRQAVERVRFQRTVVAAQNRVLEARIRARTAELQAEKEAAERLLYNILPVDIARELRRNGSAKPRRHAAATILFTDFEGFTTTVGTIPAHKLVEELNRIFSAFDDIVSTYGIEKIKTIGDAYQAVGGVPHPRPDHATVCVAAALDMLAFLDRENRHNAIKWRMRIGMHSGAVVAGVVGRHKFTYDIWGDTVNVAARLESAADAGRINVSAYTYDLIRDAVNCEYRGKIAVKGKGRIDMYHVVGIKRAAAAPGLPLDSTADDERNHGTVRRCDTLIATATARSR